MNEVFCFSFFKIKLVYKNSEEKERTFNGLKKNEYVIDATADNLFNKETWKSQHLVTKDCCVTEDIHSFLD